jgi:hypothetical protein
MCAPTENRHKEIKLKKQSTVKRGYLDLKASILLMETSHIFKVKAGKILKNKIRC